MTNLTIVKHSECLLSLPSYTHKNHVIFNFWGLWVIFHSRIKAVRWPLLINLEKALVTIGQLPSWCSQLYWTGDLYILPSLISEEQKGYKTEVVGRVHLKRVSFFLVWCLGLIVVPGWNTPSLCLLDKGRVISQRCSFCA